LTTSFLQTALVFAGIYDLAVNFRQLRTPHSS
jgi:hypothetical protein